MREVIQTRLMKVRSSQVHAVLSVRARIWIWKIWHRSPAHFILLSPYTLQHWRGTWKGLQNWELLSGHDMYWRHQRREGYIQQWVRSLHSLSWKQEKVICEIASVSVPANINSNGFINYFSPIFIKSLKTEGIIYSLPVFFFFFILRGRYNLKRYIW